MADVSEAGSSAICSICEWTQAARTARAALGHGGRHAKRTGHEVQVHIAKTVILNPVDARPPVEQEGLFT